MIKDSVNFSIINNDELEALSRLRSNSINLIYINPPWNTGTEDSFQYSKNILEQNNLYENFIYKVLQQAHRILHENGLLVVYITPPLYSLFNRIITSLFKEENLCHEYILEKRINPISTSYNHNHEKLLIFSKTKSNNFTPYLPYSVDEIKKLYPFVDTYNKRYRLQSLMIPKKHNDIRSFEWQGITPKNNSQWRFSLEKLEVLNSKNQIIFKNNTAQLIDYENCTINKKVPSIWNDINIYDRPHQFCYTESYELLERIFLISTKEEDLILIPFSSNTLPIEVCNNINRRCILINSSNIDINTNVLQERDNSNIVINTINKLNKYPIIWNTYNSYYNALYQETLELIKSGENEKVEFKESYSFIKHTATFCKKLPNKIMREIAGFLNTEIGGTILLGVDDNSQEIIGIENDIEHYKSEDKFKLAIESKIIDSFQFYDVDKNVQVQLIEINSKTICRINIAPYHEKVLLNEEYIIRKGSQTINHGKNFIN